MNLHLNESSESMQLLIHKDSHCLSSNVHTIHHLMNDSVIKSVIAATYRQS